MTVRVSRRGAIATVRFDRPSPSFASLALIDELRRTLRVLERDDAVRVIVLRGARDGEFLAHLQVDEIEAMLRDARRVPRPLLAPALLILRIAVAVLARLPGLVNRWVPAGDGRALRRMATLVQLLAFDALERSSKITVAAIEGPCIGCGLELSLCCDLRVASDREHVLLGLPESRIGMMPGFGGTQRLTRTVGPAAASAMLLRGQLVDACEAERLGLVHASWPVDAFEERLDALLEPLARRSPAAVVAIRRAIAVAAPAPRAGLFEELRLVSALARSTELDRGMRGYRAWLSEQLEAIDTPDAFAAAVEQLDAAERTWSAPP